MTKEYISACRLINMLSVLWWRTRELHAPTPFKIFTDDPSYCLKLLLG